MGGFRERLPHARTSVGEERIVCVGCIEQCNCGALCNIVVIPMCACHRGKSEARGTRIAEGAPCEGWLVVRVRSFALTW